MVKGRSSARKSVFLSSTHIGVHIGVRPYEVPGDNGHYELIHSIEQKELICGCTLFNLMNFKENEILKKIMRLRLLLLPRLPLT